MEKPKTSRQLKQLILLKEEELKNDREIINDYFRPKKTDHNTSAMLTGILTNINVPSGIKTELIKSVLVFVTGFITKKWLARKAKKKTERTDQLKKTTTKMAGDSTQNEMEPSEREILKKWLYQYIISK